MKSRTIAWPSGSRRLQVTVCLLRASCSQKSWMPYRSSPSVRSESPVPGISILMTSAPNSASRVAQNGAATNVPKSRTRRSASGLAGIGSFQDGLAQPGLHVRVVGEAQDLVILLERCQLRQVFHASVPAQLRHRCAHCMRNGEERRGRIDGDGESQLSEAL